MLLYAAVWLLKRTAVYISVLLASEREKKINSPSNWRWKPRGSLEVQIYSPLTLAVVGWVVKFKFLPFFIRDRDPLPIVELVGLNPGPVWTIARGFAPIEIWSPDGPVRRHSLYFVIYSDYALPAHIICCPFVAYRNWILLHSLTSNKHRYTAIHANFLSH